MLPDLPSLLLPAPRSGQAALGALVLLLGGGCATAPGADTGNGTAVESHTGSGDDPPDDDPVGVRPEACIGLADPWRFNDRDSGRRALTYVTLLEGFDTLVDDDAEAGCPRRTEVTDGVVRYDGGCTTPAGVTYTGTMTEDQATLFQATVWTYDDFAAAAEHGEFAWRVTGTVRVDDDGYGTRFVRASAVLSTEGDATYPSLRGIVALRGDTRGGDLIVEHVAEGPWGPGDFCYSQEGDSTYETAYWRLDGDGYFEVDRGWGAGNDDCGELYVSGTDLGPTWCDDDWLDAPPGSGLDPCNGVDDDGDGMVDEGTALAWFADADGDGFGAGLPVIACTAPAGHVPDAADCDDADAGLAPEKDEQCGDGIDQDCDGVDTPCAFAGSADPGDARGVLRGSGADAGLGVNLVASDLDDDGAPELLASVLSPVAEVHVVAASVVGEADVDTASLASFAEASARGDVLSVAVLARDGAPEVAVGARGYGADLGSYGAVYLWSGALAGEHRADTAVATLLGTCAGSGLASSTDADGSPILLVAGGDTHATVWSVPATVSGVAALDEAAQVLGGRSSGHPLVAAGDLDGDGVADLAFAGDQSDGTADGIGYGAMWIVSGPVVGVMDATDFVTVRMGIRQHDTDWLALAGGGDLDGDGRSDLAVGAPNMGDSGIVWILPGGATPSGAIDDAAFTTLTLDPYASLGTSLTLVDDDGDGAADVVAGAAGADGGALVGWRGPLVGASSTPDVAFEATRSGSFAGYRSVRLGATWAVGAPYDDRPIDDAGAVWFVDLPW